jgi:hypothetical protein
MIGGMQKGMAFWQKGNGLIRDYSLSFVENDRCREVLLNLLHCKLTVK